MVHLTVQLLVQRYQFHESLASTFYVLVKIDFRVDCYSVGSAELYLFLLIVFRVEKFINIYLLFKFFQKIIGLLDIIVKIIIVLIFKQFDRL